MLLEPIVLSGLFVLGLALDLRIIHDNDVHARYKEFNDWGQPCTDMDRTENQCFGGAARRAALVKQMKEEEPNLLYLCAGDQFQGTIWYTKFKWALTAEVMNAIGYTAMSFGNHEFDDGLPGVAPFLNNLSFPLLATNVEANGTTIEGRYEKSMVVNVNGVKVGILGYITPDTSFLSNPGPDVKFDSEISSLQEEANRLKEQGVNIILAVGHSGITKDKEICTQVDGIDVVVGGHTNTFLYSGNVPSNEIPADVYPIVIEQRNNGSKCLVVSDYAFGKYLGNLSVEFDDDGIIQSWSGNPILLDQTFAQDPEMVELLRPYDIQLEEFRNTITGYSASGLDGTRTSCRLKECNLGNLLTDIIRDYYVNKTWHEASKKGYWTEVSIALLNGGGIRDFHSQPGAPISLEDILTIFPFGNTIDRVEVNGSTLFEMFEHAVVGYTVEDAAGRFLQVSGMKVTYDLSKPEYSRVVELLALCARCSIPKYEPVEDHKTYMIATINYLINGGDGYEMLSSGVRRGLEQASDYEMLSNSLIRMGLVHAFVEGRTVLKSSVSK